MAHVSRHFSAHVLRAPRLGHGARELEQATLRRAVWHRIGHRAVRLQGRDVDDLAAHAARGHAGHERAREEKLSTLVVGNALFNDIRGHTAVQAFYDPIIQPCAAGLRPMRLAFSMWLWR